MSEQASLIVLAAGRSTRMGIRNKLLLPLGDRTVIQRAVEAAVDSRVGDVVVVTGRYEYTSLLEPYPARLIRNPDYEEGMASSIRSGVQGAGRDVPAYVILLADMPFIRADTIAQLARYLAADAIVVPYFNGAAGHPVLFTARYRRDLLELRGDVGARSVVQAYPDHVVRVDTDDPGILHDIDTEEEYQRLRRP